MGVQSNKGGQGQRNHEEIEVGETRNHVPGRAAFLSSLYACIQIILIGSECSLSIKYLVISHGRVPSD